MVYICLCYGTRDSCGNCLLKLFVFLLVYAWSNIWLPGSRGFKTPSPLRGLPLNQEGELHFHFSVTSNFEKLLLLDKRRWLQKLAFLKTEEFENTRTEVSPANIFGNAPLRGTPSSRGRILIVLSVVSGTWYAGLKLPPPYGDSLLIKRESYWVSFPRYKQP